jgi:PEGA domain
LSSTMRFQVDVATCSSTISHRPARDPMEQFSPESAIEAMPLPPPPVQELAPEPQERLFEGSARLRWLTAAVAVFAIAEALLIARLYARSRTVQSADAAVVVEFARPGADVLVDGQPVGVTPLEVKVGSRTRSIRVVSNDAPPVDGEAQALPIAVEDQSGPRGKVDARVVDDLRTAGRPRTGGVKVSSPFEVTLLENERLLGSSAGGAVLMTAGRHEFELVNSALGYRARRVVDIRPGQIVSLAVKPPNGSVSINALPWAEVWIDGSSVGETPIGNISIPLGEHDILFRHPQLGERREKAIVRSDRLTRVSANLQAK